MPGSFRLRPSEMGQKLPEVVQRKMEAFFKTSFADVRVHVGPEAARIGALAFTAGTDLYFAPGQYNPQTASGQRLLGHELTHVVQQRAGRVRNPLGSSLTVIQDPALEAEAERMGLRAASTPVLPPLPAGHHPVLRKPAGPSPFRPAVYLASAIQREVRVERIDFDPTVPEAEAFRHGFIQTNEFFNELRTAINDAAAFANYRNQLNNVITAVRVVDFAEQDIDRLAVTIGAAIAAEYGRRGLPINSPNLRRELEGLTRARLVARIVPDHTTGMNLQEQAAFATLRQIAAGVGTMSRAKGVPSSIPRLNLPQALRAGFEAVLQDIATESALWTPASFTAAYALPGVLSAEVCSRQRGKHYQGNHSNRAGWLPHVVPPANRLATLQGNIYRNASRGLRVRLDAVNARARLGLAGGAHAGQANPHRQELERLFAAEMANLTAADIRNMVWAQLAQGVSAYIEFSIPGNNNGISRLVYDYVNERFYVSAHYKWCEGYNPWFQVT